MSARIKFVLLIGFLTFFFGFAAGATLNYYLLLINHPLVLEYRASLTFVSAVIGDGIVLPIMNMLIADYFYTNKRQLTSDTKFLALIIGILVTLYFHISQALSGLVNWAMPEVWRWNILGFWHAIYMLSVASFISAFYLVCIKNYAKKGLPIQIFLVTAGLTCFFVLLRLDYV